MPRNDATAQFVWRDHDAPRFLRHEATPEARREARNPTKVQQFGQRVFCCVVQAGHPPYCLANETQWAAVAMTAPKVDSNYGITKFAQAGGQIVMPCGGAPTHARNTASAGID